MGRLDERRTGGCHASAGEGGVRREHVDRSLKRASKEARDEMPNSSTLLIACWRSRTLGPLPVAPPPALHGPRGVSRHVRRGALHVVRFRIWQI